MILRQRIRFQSGLTIPELMMGLLLFAIVSSLGIPSFQNVMRKQELNSQLGIVTSTLSYARSEAIAKSQSTAICASTDGASCLYQTDWSSGWLVFLDEDEDGVKDNGESVLRAGGDAGGTATINVIAGVGAPSVARYNASGERLDGITEIRLCAGDAESGNDANRSRTIVITNVGSSRVTRGAVCP